MSNASKACSGQDCRMSTLATINLANCHYDAFIDLIWLMVNLICRADHYYCRYCYWVVNQFLHATAGTAVARLSHCNSVRLSVCLSVTRVDQSKMVLARITNFSSSAAWKTLVSGSVKLFHKFEMGHSKW